MKKIFKIFIAVVLFSVLHSPFSASFAQDAEYNLIRHTYKINNDGTMDINFRKEIKLLRNRAITAYADKGETFILYNPAIDQLRINESYTIRKDGSRVQTPQNAFIDQLPSQCTDCGRYNGIRERVVVHTALEYDCIIVLDYTIHRKTQQLQESIVLATDCPVKRHEIIVDLPSTATDGLSISYPVDNKKIKSINDSHAFHLVATDIEQTIIENYMPANIYPTVEIKYNHNENSQLPSSLSPLPEAENVVTELFDNDPMTYATNIRDYVVDNIHTNDIPLALLDYRVSTPRETFLSGCGTPADKLHLLASMMRQAGFEVQGIEGDIVNVAIRDNGQMLTYGFSASHKNRIRLQGAAIDEQRTISINSDLVWNGNDLGGGYHQMVIPTENGSININPARLTSERKAPLRVRNCNEHYHYKIITPRTPKRILVQPVDISYTKKGIGSIKISIRQPENGPIEVVRELNIDVKDGIVTPKQYKAFRQMMQDWNTYKTVTIKSAIGKTN